MNTVSIGYYREDGDFAVLATLNNNDGIYTPETFNKLIKNIFNELFVECNIQYPDLIVLERQDAPDYVHIDD
jgi:hypothetical protein